MWFDDLSGAELRARLIQRGITPGMAEALTKERDHNQSVRRFLARLFR